MSLVGPPNNVALRRRGPLLSFTFRPSFALFGDDLRADHDALVADVDARACDQSLDLDLCPATE
jgi:hypothetical protein